MIETGDKILLKTEKETFEGVLMPEENNKIILKLKSGYNIGFEKKNVKIKLVEKQKEKHKKKEEKQKEQQKENKNLPNITILHTGGTIASKVDYETGGVIAKFTPEEIIEMFPEIKKIANISARLIKNMWSEDIRFSHYNILAKEIEKEIKKNVKGIIVTHGTDTMHYTSAALSFIIQNSPIPIIIVGAQRSSDRGSTDGAINLISAAYLITQTNFTGTAICMHENTNDENCILIQGTKCRKMHSSARNAFKPINTTPIAKINYEKKKIRFLQDCNQENNQKSKKKLKIKMFNEKIKVAILKTHTNMYAEQFSAYNKYDGLIIEGFGIAGHIPINTIDNETKEHKKITKTIKKIINSGTIIATTTQTIYGSINMNIYSTGRKMQNLGIIGNYCDMHPETAFIKLAWLLSNYKKNEIKKMYETNLVGEINKRIIETE